MKLTAALVIMSLHAAAGRQPQGEDAFAAAVASYVELHRSAAAGLSTSPEDPQTGEAVASVLSERIRERRKSARPGDIFGRAVEIRSAVRAVGTGPQGDAILASIEESNVHGIRLRVNHRYPPGLPRATMPGQLLARLPPLPSELAYGVLGRSLLLIDRRAQLVVDILPDVLPVSRAARQSPARQ